jgi:hypothetical protein
VWVEVTLAFDTGPADLTITARGVPTIEDFVRLYRDLPTHPDFRPEMSILLDVSELTDPHLSVAEAGVIGKALVDQEERYGRARIAVFAPTPVVFGLSRASDTTSAFALIEIRVTSAYDEAVAWLASPGGTI